jgi:hypothetical protein
MNGLIQYFGALRVDLAKHIVLLSVYMECLCNEFMCV